jgi:hypothetical protein
MHSTAPSQVHLRISGFGFLSAFVIRISGPLGAASTALPPRHSAFYTLHSALTPPSPRTDRQPVRNPINIGSNALSNRQPLVNNVKDRGPAEKICGFLSNFTMSINIKPSGNRQKASTNRQIQRSGASGAGLPERNGGGSAANCC